MNNYSQYTQSEFWEQTWLEVSKNNPLGEAYRNPKIWDNMAQGYHKSETDLEERKKREADLVKQLWDRGILFEGAKVLDLGCGPGNYAKAFADLGAQVVALDVSPKMIEMLHSDMSETQQSRIKTIVADWQTADLRAEGLPDKYDLVFARMTPACNSLYQFEKILASSCGWCYYAAWTGKRPDKPLDQVWQNVTGEPRNKANNQFQLIFNLLMTRGIYPEVWFHKVAWQKHEPLDYVVDYYKTLIEKVKPDIQGLEMKIKDYLAPIAKEGQILEQKEGMIGEMLWQVNIS